MDQPKPSASLELAGRLRRLSGTRIATGFGPRPPKRLLQVLHLVHEHAAAVAYRPISFGNSPFLEARIQDLLSLQREAEALLPRLRSPWAETTSRLVRLVESAAASGSRTAFVRLERFAEGTQFRRFWLPEVTCVPTFRLPLLDQAYRRVLVITGPGIGLGDEICCIPLIRALHRALPDAAFDFYGFYPGLWRQVVAQAPEHNLSGRPLLCFDAVEAAGANGGREDLLVLFINFGGLRFHQAFRIDRNRPDIMEIAVGSGVLWFAPRDDGPIQIHRAMDPVAPSNYRALRALSEAIRGRPTRDPVPEAPPFPGRERDRFEIILSPFTSKPMLLTPPDWALLLDGIRRIPGRKPMRCRVLPGTSAQSRAYAERIVERTAAWRSSEFQVEPLESSGAAGGPASLADIWKAFGASDLVLGIDTYSAHLAAELGIPAVTLCYERNLAFWPDQCQSLWIELRQPPAVMLEAISLLAAVAGGLETPAFEAFQRHFEVASWQRLERQWAEVRASGDGSGPRRARNLLDAAWDLLAPAQRRLIETLDFNLAWPRIRNWIATDPDLPEKPAWVFHLLESLHFRRIFRLLAAAADRGGNP